jgi:hypothetical protein
LEDRARLTILAGFAQLSAAVLPDRQYFDTLQILSPDEVGIVRFMNSWTWWP